MGDDLLSGMPLAGAAPGAGHEAEFLQGLREKATRVTVRDGESPTGLSLALRKER